MRPLTRSALACLAVVCVGTADAASFKETVALFKQAGESADFFSNSYAYAVFPNVAAGAVGVGGAYGKGRVYIRDALVGNVTMSQVSVGLQVGGKAYSEIIFFQDERALQDFESGKFEFGADASAVAVTSGAHAQLATSGTNTGISNGQHDATTQGAYQVGMATFIVAKGGLMVSAAVGGQKFTYVPNEAAVSH